MSEKQNRAPEEVAPLQIRHGRAIWEEVVRTQADTSTIIGLLTPAEESPVLDALARIEAKQDMLLSILLPPAGGVSAP